jgi:hypothetical protein
MLDGLNERVPGQAIYICPRFNGRGCSGPASSTRVLL